jgi:predicted NodU family carbamoyl transferase
MATLGINAVADRSSACSISATGVITAELEKHSAFPQASVDALRSSYESWDSIATVPHASNCVRSQFKRNVEIVDYCDAIAMATVASTNWTHCAVLLSDAEHTRLGYFADGSFYWIRTFEYPNSIALFSSAATRFLGFDAISGEDRAREISRRGNPVYAPWISRHVVSQEPGSYTLLHNLERGAGIGSCDANIAASVQSVFTSVLVNLATWLRKHVDSNKIAIVGRSAANYLTNSAIANVSGYEHIAAISLNGAAAVSLGAAALINRPLLEHHYVGVQQENKISAEQVAGLLLRGDIVTHISTNEFSDNVFMNRSRLTIPYEPRLHSLKDSTTYAICQDRDYQSYFSSQHTPYFGQYLSTVTNRKAINYDCARVITVGKNKNPFINRVLEITRSEGYPILVSTPIT